MARSLVKDTGPFVTRLGLVVVGESVGQFGQAEMDGPEMLRVGVWIEEVTGVVVEASRTVLCASSTGKLSEP